MNEVDFEGRAEAAIVAAAVGDALGWPQENRGARIGGRGGIEPRLELVEWRRRDGGRFQSHETVVGAGHYSDDTQLIMAIARSVLSGREWWLRWTRLELPLWLAYERGAGVATKRAAQAWAKGQPPWIGEQQNPYFAAGGNGVAMRVLPHILRGREGFREVARGIVKDGIATHGHPRAHVGALAYAYSVWCALRRQDRLPYGAIIDEVCEARDVWAQPPAVDNVGRDWWEAANSVSPGGYERTWDATVTEMMDLLDICRDAIGEGALSIDGETLEQLGARDSRISSAGTVTAAAAIFLASRYASRPEQGLMAAAFARGADTDTLASMAASLLASINGGDWLGATKEKVQDGGYLIRLAHALVKGEAEDREFPLHPDVAGFVRRIADMRIGDELPLPDDRSGRLRDIVDHPTKTRHVIQSFVVETDDGQTLFVKRVRKLSEAAMAKVGAPNGATASAIAAPAPQDPPGHRARVVVAVDVEDMDRSVAFWRDIAQVEVRLMDHYVNVAGFLALFPSGRARTGDGGQESDRVLDQARQRLVVFVDAEEFSGIDERLGKAKVPRRSISIARGRRGIRCADPDGNVVEFRERNGLT